MDDISWTCSNTIYFEQDFGKRIVLARHHIDAREEDGDMFLH